MKLIYLEPNIIYSIPLHQVTTLQTQQTIMTQIQPKKHQEFILAVEEGYFLKYRLQQLALNTTSSDLPFTPNVLPQVIPFDFNTFCQEALPYLTVKQRAGLETNPNYRQLLPYVIISQKDKDGIRKYVSYWRAKGSGESRLLNGLSIGFGGHVDHNDIIGPMDPNAEEEGETLENGEISLSDTLQVSVVREMDEEIYWINTEADSIVSSVGDGSDVLFTSDDITNPTLFILSHDPKVGIYHVGMVIEVEIPSHWKINSDEDAIAMDEETRTLEELLANEKLEDWSRLYLEYVQSNKIQLVEIGDDLSITEDQFIELQTIEPNIPNPSNVAMDILLSIDDCVSQWQQEERAGNTEKADNLRNILKDQHKVEVSLTDNGAIWNYIQVPIDKSV